MNMSGMDMAPEWPAALIAWPAVLAQMLIFGSAMLCLMLNGSSAGQLRSGQALARKLAIWWRIFASIVALLTPLMFVNEVAGMAGVSMRSALPLMGEVLAQTQSGHTWRWRLPIALALLLAAWMPMREWVRSLALAVLCATLFLAGSFQSHAIDFGTTAIALRFIHVLAAGAWTGSLFGYWVAARSHDRDSRGGIEAAKILSRLAAWSVSILIASGIYIAYEGLGHNLTHVFYSSYGRVLSIKVEVFAVVLVIGAYNRFFIVPAIDEASARRTLVRTVGAECLMIIGIVGLASLLAATPPARMSMLMSLTLDQPRKDP
jgi:putative copper resistance protein D